jgi:hypothetical protein
MKRLRNSSGIPDVTINNVVSWIAAELGIDQFDVEVRNCSGTLAGSAYTKGARSYHGNRRPFVVLRVGTETVSHFQQTVVTPRFPKGMEFHYSRRSHAKNPELTSKIVRRRFPATVTPYQYGQHKGRRYLISNRTEALVYIAAHELRHLWQAARLCDDRKSRALMLAHGAHGKFSEIDTEAFAIHMLRAWRRRIQS